MITINFTLTYFKSLPVELKLDLTSLCLKILGNEDNTVIIDNVRIKNRDVFFDWQMNNNMRLT